MRFLAILIALSLWANAPARAQGSDSLFADYDAYADFVDSQVMTRKFIPLIQQLGGRDEFTEAELNANQRQMEAVWPRNFEHVRVFRRTDLGGGLVQEGRLYWTGMSYAFFYALLHQRENDLAVVSFLLNSSSKPIMERF